MTLPDSNGSCKEGIATAKDIRGKEKQKGPLKPDIAGKHFSKNLDTSSGRIWAENLPKAITQIAFHNQIAIKCAAESNPALAPHA